MAFNHTDTSIIMLSLANASNVVFSEEGLRAVRIVSF